MVRAGYITSADAREASLRPPPWKVFGARLEQLFRGLDRRGFARFAGQPDTDLVVRTTIDPALQRAAEEIVGRALAEEGRSSAPPWPRSSP